MKDILEEIVAHKRVEVERSKMLHPMSVISKEAEQYISGGRHEVISMSRRLSTSSSGIIAEFKRRSPSKGWIKESGKAEEIPLSYSLHGASGISILTDKHYFGGCQQFLETARRLVTDTPILRKDFIIDEYQLFEARLMGADAVLLIASDLKKDECRRFARLAHDLGLEILLEIHSESELDYVGENIDMVGVNNRHLGTFHTDVATSFRLASLLPEDYVLVSESGISQPQTVRELREAGFRGFLIGETFMRCDEPGEALGEFIEKVVG
jgi:indole-3-glycerol phosphate synthase